VRPLTVHFFFSSRRRHTRSKRDWSSDVCSSDLDTFVSIVEAIEEDPDRFEWVVVDSITKLQDIIWNKILAEAVAKNPSRSPYKRELQEYGEAQSRLKDLVERLKNSDANVLFIALADSELDEDGNTVRVPAIHGSQGKVQ